MTKTRRGFTDEFKCEAIKLVNRPGAKVSQTARDLGIDQRVLRRWLEQVRGGVLDTRPSRPIRSETTSEGERLQRDLRRVTMGRDLPKKAGVRSISQGNTRASSVSTGVAKPSVHAWSVELFGDCSELPFGRRPTGRAFGELLAPQPVGVFMSASLPWATRITEVHLNVGGYREALVVRQLRAAIPSKRGHQPRRQLLNLARQRADHAHRVLAFYPDQHGIAGMALHQSGNLAVARP